MSKKVTLWLDNGTVVRLKAYAEVKSGSANMSAAVRLLARSKEVQETVKDVEE